MGYDNIFTADVSLSLPYCFWRFGCLLLVWLCLLLSVLHYGVFMDQVFALVTPSACLLPAVQPSV